MIQYLVVFLIIVLTFLSLPTFNNPDLTSVSYIRSCLYIHEYNFLNNLLFYSNLMYTIYTEIEHVKQKIIVGLIRSFIKQNYVKILRIVIKMYKHNDMCISQHTRTLVIPIESMGSLEYFRYVGGMIRYVGDGSLANEGLLEKILDINFDDGILCLDCKQGRFVVISEHYNKQLAYYKIIEGKYKLEKMSCIDKTALSMIRIKSILKPVLDHLRLCE